jgi:hypothetical protein
LGDGVVAPREKSEAATEISRKTDLDFDNHRRNVEERVIFERNIKRS